MLAETRYGRVRGAEIADGVLGWRGIPYAAPPVDGLRLRPPQPPGPWTGVREATEYGHRSLQPEPNPEPRAPPASEDCLYLNVTAPAGARDRPVLFWIHGGGYEMGHGIDQAGDGAAFASSHGLVVVTFNYRLGALGFFDVPGERPAGALGLHDQIAALRWTHENIAGFGGDPCQITVYGLSAGGKTVTNLLASPLTRGLIARAAESSGAELVASLLGFSLCDPHGDRDRVCPGVESGAVLGQLPVALGDLAGRLLFEHQVSLRWRDVDALGHVNHAVFLTYLEEGRDAFYVQALGRDPHYVVARVEIDLRAEVRYTDRQLRVRIEVERVGATSLTTRETVLTPAGATAAEARVVTVLWDASTRKPMEFAADERARLATHCPRPPAT